MAKVEVPYGQTDYSVLVWIPDSASTTGAGNTGLAYTDIDVSYARVETDNDVAVTACAPATLATITAAHSDWGFIEVDATEHPGLYRLDLADGVFAAGAWSAVVTIRDAASNGVPPVVLEFQLVDALSGNLKADAITSATIDATVGTEIADAVLNRATSNVESSVVPKSLGAAVMKLTHRVKDDGAGNLVIYKSNGSTTAYSQAITATSAAAAPITDLGGAA